MTIGLIETMRWEGGLVKLLPLHLARVCASASYFWGLSSEVVAERISVGLASQGEELSSKGAGPMRLRAEVWPDRVLWRCDALALDSPFKIWRVVLSNHQKPEGDFFRHKTTQRLFYDRCRAELGPEDDEMILRDAQGEICEGTITSVFVPTPQGLKTPPLSSGALPGVLRRSLIDQGLAYEGRVTDQDLQVDFFYVGNAVQGLKKAQLVPHGFSSKKEK